MVSLKYNKELAVISGEDYKCRCWAEPYKPERYADKPISSETISDKVIKHLEKDIKFIKDNIPEFYKYPPIIQDVFIDFQYNTGNCLQFVRFRKWVNAKNLDKLIEESFRPDVGKSRNDSIAARLRSNKDWDY